LDRHERLVIVGCVWTDNGLRDQRLRDFMVFKDNSDSQIGDSKNRVMVGKFPGKLKADMCVSLFAFEGFGSYIDSPFADQCKG
jgi:hypothetical protein